MSKRLQVLLDPTEYKSFQKLAKESGMALGEWVRQALRRASASFSEKKPCQKLKNIRQASQHRCATGDMEQILAEIEKGYVSDIH